MYHCNDDVAHVTGRVSWKACEVKRWSKLLLAELTALALLQLESCTRGAKVAMDGLVMETVMIRLDLNMYVSHVLNSDDETRPKLVCLSCSKQ